MKNFYEVEDSLKLNNLGNEIHGMISEMYPICRSITGNGFRDTLRIISKYIPIKVKEVPSGTKAFDWTIPKEWNIKDAYVKNSKGKKIIDFQKSNLHVVNYSIPIKAKMPLSELKKRIFTLPDKPKLVPYRTSYYEENWGFCMSHDDFIKLKEGEYEVMIDSSLSQGSLTYGEYFIKGKSKDEIIISAHSCHPSLCNDNLSGVAVAATIGRELSEIKTKYSYRFLFIPGSIGSITWLSQNEDKISNVKGGLVLSGIGDSGNIHYKKSRNGDGLLDKAMAHVLKQSQEAAKMIEFSPFGYDERQYCSPGINLSVGCFMRTPYSEYPEYHTSADNLDFVKAESLADSFGVCMKALGVLEGDGIYLNLNPKCEPQLGKRGIYKAMGEQKDNVKKMQMAMLWVLNFSDGKNSLLDIAERSGFNFTEIKKAAKVLEDNNLVKQL